MKVKDLIKELEKCDQDSYVIVQEYDGANDIGRVLQHVKKQSARDAYVSPASAKIIKKSNVVLLTAFKL